MAHKVENESWSSISESVLIENFPLHRACRDGDIPLLTKLVQQKDSANVHMCLEDTYYGWTPLHWAAYFGKPDCLRVILKFSDPPTTDLKTSRFNQTPAHIAAFAGHPHCLHWLVQAGTDINTRDYLGETPLHKAARSGSEECVSLLVNSKALSLVKNDNDKTPAELAHTCQHVSVGNFLLNVQKQEQLSTPLVSSNGYYGYQPLNGSSLKTKTNPDIDATMEMETEDAHPISFGTSNGSTNGSLPNGTTNGIQNGSMNPSLPAPTMFNGHVNGVNPHANGRRVNGFGHRRSLTNGLNGDITLSVDVSQNKVPIAGKKRSREETFCAPQMKRIRTEDFSAFTTPPSLLAFKTSLSPKMEISVANTLPFPASLTSLNSYSNGTPNSSTISPQSNTSDPINGTTKEQNRNGDESNSVMGDKEKENIFHLRGNKEDVAMTTSTNFELVKQGGSGSCLVNPVPIADTQSAGYMGTGLGGCIGVRSRCLLGHYMIARAKQIPFIP